MIGPGNQIKELVRWALAESYKSLRLSALDICVSGTGSKVNFWRVRPSPGAKFLVGDSSLIRTDVVFELPGAEVNIGNRTFIGRGLFSIAQKLEIGDDVMLAWGVTITDHNSHSLQFSVRRDDVVNVLKGVKFWDGIKIAPVKISDKAWIGFGSSILKGVTIGEGAVVAANSVVTQDVEPWTIVGGNPAKLIRKLTSDER